MLGIGTRKLTPLYRRDEDGGGTIWSLGFSGDPLDGTDASDFLLALTAGTVNGADGDDLILGDIGSFRASTPSNNSFANANDLDSNVLIWSVDENPLFGVDEVPHATIHIAGEGTQEYFKIVVGAGQTLTVDIDGAGGTLGSDNLTDTRVEIFISSDLVTPVASDDSSAASEGGYGSVSAADAFLVFTNNGAGATYYIRIREAAGDGNFEADDEFLVNVSLTGHATGGSTTLNDDRLSGDNGADHLFGAAGDDVLLGGDGDDLMHGGTGSDTYSVDSALDISGEAAAEGDDRVIALVSYALAAGVSVETMSTADHPGIGAIDMTGNELANRIEGNNVQNILRGEGGGDTLFGFSGNDFLVGGTGADIMVGSFGDDTYYFDDVGDALSEFAGQGNDRLATTITLALAADADIERLDVEALTSTNAIDLTGSAIGNVIYGNDGTNILRGEAGNDELRGFGGSDFLVGGAGTDTMVGGTGDDTFYVDDAGDAIGENVGEGNDRIAASVSFVLSNGANVELLEAVNLLATTAFDLTGSDSANTITGNNGVNILRGEGGNDILSAAAGDDFLVGGTGADDMTGGAGNDTYYVDNSNDDVNEIAGEGTSDRLVASIGYALASDADVELLETATQSGTNPISLFGSNIANTINGNDGANILDGKNGSDTLNGFGGADIFQFSTALGAGNVDTILGFVGGSDKIRLEDSIFAGLPLGTLNANAFVTGSQAADADDRIVYNSATGALLYDADGNGAGAAVQFATLQGAPAIAASDFTVI